MKVNSFGENHVRSLGLLILFTALTLLTISVSLMATETKMNKYCPVTTSELAEEQFSLEYGGKQIYLCCNKCKKEFLLDPEAYLANLATTTDDTAETVTNQENDHGDEADEAGEAHDDGEEHDHATGHSESSKFLTLIGKFHPLVVHFPIAIIPVALLFALWSLFTHKQGSMFVSAQLMYIAAVAVVGAVALGLVAYNTADYPSFLQFYLDWHLRLGLFTGALTLFTAYIGHRAMKSSFSSGQTLFLILLAANAIMVGISAHFGGTLVFGPDYFNL